MQSRIFEISAAVLAAGTALLMMAMLDSGGPGDIAVADDGNFTSMGTKD